MNAIAAYRVQAPRMKRIKNNPTPETSRNDMQSVDTNSRKTSNFGELQ